MNKNPDQSIQELIHRRDYQQAEKLLLDRLRQNDQDSDAHYLMGVLNYFRGQVSPTIKSLKKALSIDPRHTDSAICLSVLLNDLGKYDEAKKIFEQANHSVLQKKEGVLTAIDLKFAVKHLELADLYFRYRRFDEAIEEYSKAVMLNPAHLEIRIRRAKAYARKGYLTRALQDLQQLKQEHPGYAPGKIQLGLLHYSQGNWVEADMEWESVLSTDPAHREARAYLEMSKQNRIR